MTVPASAVGPPPSVCRQERAPGPLGWLAVPALVFFIAFGVIPLIGVLLLSFTTWDGIGEVIPSGFTSWKAALTNPGLPHAMWVTFRVRRCPGCSRPR